MDDKQAREKQAEINRGMGIEGNASRQARRAAEREAAKAAESDEKVASMAEVREVQHLRRALEGAHVAAKGASTALVAFIRGHMEAIEVVAPTARLIVITCPEGMGLRQDVSQMLATALGAQVLVLPGGSTVSSLTMDELMALSKKPSHLGIVDANGAPVSE